MHALTTRSRSIVQRLSVISKQTVQYNHHYCTSAAPVRSKTLDERQKLRLKFSFISESTEKDEETRRAVEKFEYPEYWKDDYPAKFDDQMKHEVDKLMVFRDFAMLFSDAWEKQIHPKLDGSKIKLSMSCPLKDFNEILFVEDQNTFDTKVVMEVPLSAFHGLSKKGITALIGLVGCRYNQNKKVIKITEDRYTSRLHNHKRLCDILRELTETAHKVSVAQMSR